MRHDPVLTERGGEPALRRMGRRLQLLSRIWLGEEKRRVLGMHVAVLLCDPGTQPVIFRPLHSTDCPLDPRASVIC